MKLAVLISELTAGWRTFVRLPLPLFMQNERVSSVPLDGPGTWIRPLMPVIGGFLGLLVTIPLWILIQLPNGTMTAALAGAVAAPLFLEIALGWEGLNALTYFFDLRRHGATQEEALSAEYDSHGTVSRGTSSVVILLTIYILRMIFLGVLASFAPFWIIVSLAGSWLIRAELLGLNRPGEYGSSYLKTAKGWEKRHWYIALAVMLAAGLFHPFGVLLAFAVAWLLAWVASNMCLESISGITKQAYGVFGYTGEMILFFLGVLLYAAPR